VLLSEFFEIHFMLCMCSYFLKSVFGVARPLAIAMSLVRVLPAALPSTALASLSYVLHLSTSSISWYWRKGGSAQILGR